MADIEYLKSCVMEPGKTNDVRSLKNFVDQIGKYTYKPIQDNSKESSFFSENSKDFLNLNELDQKNQEKIQTNVEKRQSSYILSLANQAKKLIDDDKPETENSSDIEAMR